MDETGGVIWQAEAHQQQGRHKQHGAGDLPPPPRRRRRRRRRRLLCDFLISSAVFCNGLQVHFMWSVFSVSLVCPCLIYLKTVN